MDESDFGYINEHLYFKKKKPKNSEHYDFLYSKIETFYVINGEKIYQLNSFSKIAFRNVT